MTLSLQTCEMCGAVQYPRRAVCRRCLSDRLVDREQPGGGRLLAHASISLSLDPAGKDRLPLAAGTVLLDAGTQVIALLQGEPAPGARVTMRWIEEEGRRHLVAVEEHA